MYSCIMALFRGKKIEFMTLQRANSGHSTTGRLLCEMFFLLKILWTSCFSQQTLHHLIIDTTRSILHGEYRNITADAFCMTYLQRVLNKMWQCLHFLSNQVTQYFLKYFEIHGADRVRVNLHLK